MEGYMGENAVNSKEGKVFIVRNKQNIVLARATSLETTLTFNKTEIRMLGRRAVGQKVTSWSGSGTMGLYQSTSEIKKWAIDYVKNGVVPYFNIQSSVSDPSTPFGTESIIYVGCLFDELTMSAMSTDDGVLEDEISFTYEDIELLEEFIQKVQGEL